MKYRHPKYTMYCTEAKGNFDFIYYTPSCMQVTHVLKMPNDSDVTQELDLPNTKFPSDHLRIQSKFTVFYDDQSKEELKVQNPEQ